jgi:ketosteroid isomerase-like protein
MKIIIILASLLLTTLAYSEHHGEKEALSPNVAVVKAGYDAFAIGDMEAWAAVQSDDVVWDIPVGLPYSGSYTGTEAIKQGVIGPISEMWPEFKVEPIHFYESGNVVFVHGKMTAEGLDTETVHMVTVKDGKYSRFQPFDDSAAMMKAAKK